MKPFYETEKTPVEGGTDSPVPSPTLTVQEIAEKYGLHDKTVRGMISNGVFPNAYREINGKTHRWKVPAADLENFTPRRKGAVRIAAPTSHAIRSRSRWAKTRMKDSHGYGKSEVREMIDLETQGMTREEIAVRFQLDESIVSDLLESIALRKSRPKIKPSVEKALKRLPEEQLIELYVEKDLPTADILEQLNTNYASLYINLRHYGIPLRNKRFHTAAQENEILIYRLVFEDNLSPQVIATRLELTEAYVRRKINEIKRRLGAAKSPGSAL